MSTSQPPFSNTQAPFATNSPSFYGNGLNQTSTQTAMHMQQNGSVPSATLNNQPAYGMNSQSSQAYAPNAAYNVNQGKGQPAYSGLAPNAPQNSDSNQQSNQMQSQMPNSWNNAPYPAPQAPNHNGNMGHVATINQMNDMGNINQMGNPSGMSNINSINNASAVHPSNGYMQPQQQGLPRYNNAGNYPVPNAINHAQINALNNTPNNAKHAAVPNASTTPNQAAAYLNMNSAPAESANPNSIPQDFVNHLQEHDLDYIPLHVHSDYSIMDGLESVEAIVKRAVKLKIPAVALTDWTNVCGFIKFYNSCRSNGIKPIMGADLKLEDQIHQGEAPQVFRLTILAMDNIGRQNLYDILSEAWLRSDAGEFNAHTRLEELAKFNEGLIVLAGFRSDIAYYIREKNESKLQERLKFYKDTFGDRFCLEITRTERENELEFENHALELCMEYGIPPVATNDTCFLLGPTDIGKDGLSDYQVHDVRVSIQRKCMRGNEEIAREYSPQQYLRSPEEMRSLFADLPEALLNTRRIAERCNIELELDHPRLPRYPTGDLTPAECLRQKAHEGLKERLEFLYPDPTEREKERPRYEERLNTELDVIITMDFPGYFLIVMEFIQWSKDHGVPVGPGRGSGGGSLVAYALKITDFDPMAFDLLFERFLNPERVSMPDFDVDFCQRNREKTLEHVKVNYGKDAVSQIAAFGTMAPKAAIKDVGRALGMTYGSVDYVAKQLPQQPGLSFNAALGIDKKGNPCESCAPDFQKLYNQALQNDDKARIELIHYAMRLEGVIKIIGKHAAGVVISPTRTAEFTPLMLDSDGNPITQFDKKDVEHAGLVKFDFLGLTTLTIIQDAVDMINVRKKRMNEPLVNVQSIPYHDEASFKMLQECETTAVFQLESDGMRKLIGQMKPDRFDDMIALVALYRPGPIKSGMVDHFVKRKHGEEEVSYPSPDFQDLDLKPILDSTYGVIVYQEQVMQIAQVLAGYSLGGADILRRAMGKKNPAEMASQRSVFKEGAEKKGKDSDIAMKIFDQVEKFAEYGFNKSHSAAYALVAWWTLYLKVHYPAEFLAAMMTADRQHTEKLVTYIAECQRLNIKVNPPDVTISRFDFTVDLDGSIIYGLGAIKGIGEDLVAQIVEKRETQNGFANYFDFVSKVGTSRLNKKSMESLIYSGALDKLGPSRAQMFASLTKALKYAAQKKDEADSGQTDLFAMFDSSAIGNVDAPDYDECLPWPEKYILQQEKQILGLYVSGHPLNAYRSEIARYCTTTLSRIKPGTFDHPSIDTICAVVMSYNERMSKKDGSKFYVIYVDDSTVQREFLLYGGLADTFAKILQEREEEQNRRLAVSETLDDSLKTPAPLILVITLSTYAGSEGTRERVRRIDTVEMLRRKHGRSITIALSRKFYDEHSHLINEILMRNAISTAEINQRLMNSGMQGHAGMPVNQHPYTNPNFQQGRHNSQDKGFVDEGCSLSLMIDAVKVNFAGRRFRFVPTDDLVESLRDLAGFNAVQITYN